MARVGWDIWHGNAVELAEQLKPNINCIITDPPFGVDNYSKSAVTAHGREWVRKIANDASVENAIEVFDDVMDVLLPKTVDEADLYVFTSHKVIKEWLEVADRLDRHGYRRYGILIWDKDGPGMGNVGSWGMGYEFIIYLKKGNRRTTGARRGGVQYVPQVRPQDLIHPHEKPLGLLELFIEHSTSPGDFIVDPFAGSGSTVRAAKRLGDRSALGFEMDEKNFRLAHHALHTQSDSLF